MSLKQSDLRKKRKLSFIIFFTFRLSYNFRGYHFRTERQIHTQPENQKTKTANKSVCLLYLFIYRNKKRKKYKVLENIMEITKVENKKVSTFFVVHSNLSLNKTRKTGLFHKNFFLSPLFF